MANQQQQGGNHKASSNGVDRDLQKAANIVTEEAGGMKDAATRVMNRVSEAVPTNVSEQIRSVASGIKTTISDVRSSSSQYLGQGEDFIRRYPLASVIGAVAVGALFSGIMRRSKH